MDANAHPMLTRDEHLCELHQALNESDASGANGITRIDEGFRLRATETYIVEVHKMLFNWRLVVFEPDALIDIKHGYCFFGTDLATLARAVAAGLEWVDPMNTPPADFDKQAY